MLRPDSDVSDQNWNVPSTKSCEASDMQAAVPLEDVRGRPFAIDTATLMLGRDEMELVTKLVGKPDFITQMLSRLVLLAAGCAN